MLLLLTSIGIALTVIVLGMIIVGQASRHINVSRLQIFIALASGFMLAFLFLDLLPDNIILFPAGPRTFFEWSLIGVVIVIFFERYVVPRLKFVERFFQEAHPKMLEDMEHCDHSHDHHHDQAHVHQHTHPEVIGHGEACSAIACFMICSFFDGIALSSVQVVDKKLGVSLVLGIILHLLPEGILSGAMALAGGASLSAARKVLIFIGGAFFVGAVIPLLITGYETYFLALASGIILFVTLVQLLPTALRLRFAPLWIGVGIGLFLACHAVVDWVS